MQEPVVQAMSSPEPEPEPEPEYHVHQNYMAASDGFFRPDEPAAPRGLRAASVQSDAGRATQRRACTI